MRAGEAKGKAQALLAVLHVGGVEISLRVEQQILACADAALLSQGLKRAGW